MHSTFFIIRYLINHNLLFIYKPTLLLIFHLFKNYLSDFFLTDQWISYISNIIIPISDFFTFILQFLIILQSEINHLYYYLYVLWVFGYSFFRVKVFLKLHLFQSICIHFVIKTGISSQCLFSLLYLLQMLFWDKDCTIFVYVNHF